MLSELISCIPLTADISLTRILRFGLVGLSGTIIDFGITSLFKEVFKVRKYIANSIGFISAATSNFFFNRVWTFQSTNPDILFQFIKFLTISLIGLIINNIIIYLLTDLKFRIKFYHGKIIATGIVFIWNFVMNSLLTF